MFESIEDIRKKAYENYVTLKEMSELIAIQEPITANNWVELIEKRKEEVLSLKKDFSFTSFENFGTQLKDESFNINTLRIYSTETSFSLKTKGVFFYINNPASIILNKESESIIFGLTEKGKWLKIVLLFTYTDKGLDEVSLLINELSLEELLVCWIGDKMCRIETSTYPNYVHFEKYFSNWREKDEFAKNEGAIMGARRIWEALHKHVYFIYERSYNKLLKLERLTETFALQELILKDGNI